MKCWPGMHDWEIVGTTSCFYGTSTITLRKCKDCGKLKTHELRGQWTVEQLRGKDDDLKG